MSWSAIRIATVLRAFRRTELLVLVAAIAVAVSASSTVGLFTDRLQGAIRIESATALAADLRLESGRSAASLDLMEREAQRRDLQTGRTTTLTSVVHAGDIAQLTSIIASDGGYPLRGTLRISPTLYGPSQSTQDLPPVGQVFIDPRLASRLKVNIGEIVRVGVSQLQVAAILADRPDRGTGMAEVAPALLMRGVDLAASGLIGPASRATYALLVAGDPDAMDRFSGWVKLRKSAAEKLLTVAESSAQLGSASERAGRFLHLAAITTVLLAAIALAMASRRFARQRQDEVALLKCLGATRQTIIRRFAVELMAAAIAGALLGVCLGYAAQSGLAELAKTFTAVAVLPPASVTPAILGVITAIVMMAGFAAPPIMELARIPPARVLREDLSGRKIPLFFPALGAVVSLLAILYLYVNDLALVLGAGCSLALVTIIYALIGNGLVLIAKKIRPDSGVAWRYGMSALARRPRETTAQLLAFGLGMTILLLLGVVRVGLLDAWRGALPATAPNYFLINIAPTERSSIEQFFSEKRVPIDFAPWVRGRLLSVNGTLIANRMPKSDRGRAFAEREQNLSFSADLPPDNELVEGQWWSRSSGLQPAVSVATEFRDELNLHLGDRLVFDVGGDMTEAKIQSFRKVRWDGFRPNFFLLFSPGVLDASVGSFLAATHLDEEGRKALLEFDQKFPTVTVLDIDGVLNSVRTLIDRAAAAITYVFAFTLLAGLVVLLAAVRATADERRYEIAVLRAFGASRLQIVSGGMAEFAILGALSGGVAAIASSAIGFFIASHWLGVPWRPTWSIWLWGVSAGTFGVTLFGTASTWRMSATRPARVLRGQNS